MNPGSLLGDIFQIAGAIYDQVEMVNGNKNQCRSLSEKIRQITGALRGLDHLPETEHFTATLSALETCLTDCKEFVGQFTSKNWFKKAVLAGRYKEKFADLTRRLVDLLPQLNVGLTAEMIFNHEKELAAEAKDREELLCKQDEILRVEESIYRRVQASRLGREDLEKIIAGQLESLKSDVRHKLAEEPDAKASPLDSSYTIAFHELTITDLIGEDSFGKMYKGEYRGQVVAIKLLETLTAAEREHFIQEVQTISKLRSPHIVQFYAACLEDGHACYLMEHMKNGPLSRFISLGVLSDEKRHEISLQLARGLNYLHQSGVIHGNISLTNIFINSHMEAKWTNFYGKKRSLTSASDVHDFGTVLWSLWTGKIPEEVAPEMREDLSGIPEHYADLIRGCWDPDPEKRPAMSDCVEILKNRLARPQSPTAEEYYESGQTLAKAGEYKDAEEHLVRAAVKGEPRAFTELGLFFLTSRDRRPVDKRRAFNLFQKAATAEHPHIRAMYNLGEMLRTGDGIPQNLDEAKHWFSEILRLNPSDKKAQEKINWIETQITTGEKNER